MKRFLLSLALVGAGSLHAQAIGGRPGAKFAAARGVLQLGVGGSYLRPDYGPGVGGMINPYAALDFKKSYFGVELDGNIGIKTHSDAKPDSFMAGLRIGADLGDARIYLKPAIGLGHFRGATTAPSGNSETYLVYEVGGGVDYQIAEHLNARAFGAYQIWPSFDGNTTAQYDHGGVLNPIFGGVGLAYRF